jgi:hypothetical protein
VAAVVSARGGIVMNTPVSRESAPPIPEPSTHPCAKTDSSLPGHTADPIVADQSADTPDAPGFAASHSESTDDFWATNFLLVFPIGMFVVFVIFIAVLCLAP